MTSTIQLMTSDLIQERRQRLLDDIGMDLATLKSLGERYQLTPELSAVLQELEGLEFLAGE